jgi:vesicle-associated membrane protein 7
VADNDMGQRIPYAFLADIRDRFFSQYANDWKNASELGLDDFSRTLRDRMNFYSNDPEADKINKVKGQVKKAQVRRRNEK